MNTLPEPALQSLVICRMSIVIHITTLGQMTPVRTDSSTDDDDSYAGEQHTTCQNISKTTSYYSILITICQQPIRMSK